MEEKWAVQRRVAYLKTLLSDAEERKQSIHAAYIRGEEVGDQEEKIQLEIAGREKEIRYLKQDPETRGKTIDIEIVKQTSITDMIGEQPQNKLGNIWWYKCIFHSEKSASLAVYIQQNRFHCYGCGADGSVIDLVMKQYDCSFMEAAKKIAI